MPVTHVLHDGPVKVLESFEEWITLGLWAVGSNLRVVRPLTQSLIEFFLKKGLHKTITIHSIKGYRVHNDVEPLSI